jgi:hypothetical protein
VNEWLSQRADAPAAEAGMPRDRGLDELDRIVRSTS